MPFLLALPLLLPLFGFAANECARPPTGFEAARDSLFSSLEELTGHIRNTQCLVASCDPSGSNDGRCYTSTHEKVLAAQARFAAKVQKAQAHKAALKAVLDKYSAQLKSLGAAPMPKVEAGLACRGALDAAKTAITQREAPLKELAASLMRLRSRQLLVEELNEMNRTFQTSVAQLRPRPFQFGPITVNLPCQPNLAQEYIRTREKLEKAVNDMTALEANLVAEDCVARGMRAEIDSSAARCDTVAAPPVAAGTPGVGTGANVPPKKEPPARVDTAPVQRDPPANVATPAPRDPPANVATPAPRDPPPVVAEREPSAVKEPERQNRLSREDWKKKDELMEMIQAPMPRLYSTDDSLKSFLDQARTQNRADYALRVQAAINATALDMNGESIGPAPTVYQDGLIGSRTRGAVDYYLRDRQARELFLQHLASYGITIR